MTAATLGDFIMMALPQFPTLQVQVSNCKQWDTCQVATQHTREALAHAAALPGPALLVTIEERGVNSLPT